jgi:hypothetical protein
VRFFLTTAICEGIDSRLRGRAHRSGPCRRSLLLDSDDRGVRVIGQQLNHALLGALLVP